MSGLFARVVKQAFITFDQTNASKFKTNFNTLKLLVDQLTPKDLNIDPQLMQSSTFMEQNKAPVTYVGIFEHETFTMSVFIVRNRYTMPLHDHPGFGLLRVISGTAKIQSYSLLNASGPPQSTRARSAGPPIIVPVIKEPIREVTTQSESSMLTPTECNIHEITAVNGDPVAFFDILSPPYNSHLSIYGPKQCSFYQKVQTQDENGDSLNCDTDTDHKRTSTQLQKCSTPPHYYCDSVNYYPPEFLREYH